MSDKTSLSDAEKYWENYPCGVDCTTKALYSKEYFDEIEKHRYQIEPEIHSFAQFSRYRGKKVLEVGVGAGTDFIQWARAGALAHGIDLSPTALRHTALRLYQEGLCAQKLTLASACAIPYADDMFDCVYSWGVIHHTPDIKKAFGQLVRVTKPGGELKVMVYHRRSLYALYRYLLYVKTYKNPWVSLTHVLAHFQESPGTQALTLREGYRLCEEQFLENISITPLLTSHDLLFYKKEIWQKGAGLLAALTGGNRRGWFLLIKGNKRG